MKLASEKETLRHFPFECPEAKILWSQISVIFPEYQDKTELEKVQFVRKGSEQRTTAQFLRDDAVATALHMRWRERAKASTTKDYVYNSLSLSVEQDVRSSSDSNLTILLGDTGFCGTG